MKNRMQIIFAAGYRSMLGFLQRPFRISPSRVYPSRARQQAVPMNDFGSLSVLDMRSPIPADSPRRAELRIMLRDKIRQILADPQTLREGLLPRAAAFLPFAGGTPSTNFVPRYDSSGNLVDTSAPIVDLSGKVGIGTAGPVAQGEVYGAGQTTAALSDAGARGGMLMLNDSGTSGGNGGALAFGNAQSHNANSVGFAALKGLLADGSSNTRGHLAISLRYATGDSALTERVRITSDGSVGIGTTSPGAGMEINKGATNDPALLVNSSGAGWGSGIRFKNTGGGSREYGIYVDNATPNNWFFADVTAGAARMTISASGNVGVGTSSPMEKLDVDGNAVFSGFLGLGGTAIHDNDSDGYVVCFFDNEAHPFVNPINEMRGYQATMNYARTNADANVSGAGWDVFGFGGAVVLKNMNLPGNDPNIRGQMKPFQSELYFQAGVASYNVVGDTMNYVASLEQVDSSCSITRWIGVAIHTPCSQGGHANNVVTGYGVGLQDLDDSAHTLVAGTAAAIKIDGLNQYGRILWTDCSVYCPSSGTLELKAGTAVQTASGVPFNSGSYINAVSGFKNNGSAGISSPAITYLDTRFLTALNNYLVSQGLANPSFGSSGNSSTAGLGGGLVVSNSNN